ncbi:MAG: RodZ domain-containing protein [Acidobacteriota bacterium]
MTRLRIRIELNRGGVGVPLHKLASVVDEAQKFFYLLTEDVQIDQTKGEWLGFDFGNESLNFTAEFVGPVTAEQVAAFHAAFDGTTSLRRATISQFARITDAIEQDELIGFGLYLSDEGNEPTEWRCLSRRDALRITEEIQLLIAASGEAERESHLPAVATTGAGARVFSDRRERGLESAKWAAYVREVEANMDRRITRVEEALEGQSGMIEDLHSKSTSTEDSVRKLLTAVEGFCAQTTRQLEAISAPALAAAVPPVLGAIPETPATEPQTAPAAAGAVPVAEAISEAPAAERLAAPAAAAAAAGATQIAQTIAEAPATERQAASTAEPVTVEAPIAEKLPKPDPQPVKAQPPFQPWNSPAETARKVRPSQPAPVELGWAQKLDWRLAGGAALLVVGVVIIGAWAWQNLFSEPSVQRVSATSPPASSPAPTAVQPQPIEPPAETPKGEAAPKSAARTTASAGQQVTLEASELTWVSARDAAGKQMLARVFQQGDSQNLDLPNGATVRVGNAGGLSILLNGTSIGAVGKHGQVREVVFRNSSYKVVEAN